MRECRCDIPDPYVGHPNPAKADKCRRCGCFVDPEYIRIDSHVAEFFDRLAESQFHYYPEGHPKQGTLMTPDWWDDFREHCTVRELSGRDKFKLDYLARNNPIEACEEAADGALYMLLHGLRSLREGWADDTDVRLMAAYHFAQAHRYARMIAAKQRGNTGPGLED